MLGILTMQKKYIYSYHCTTREREERSEYNRLGPIGAPGGQWATQAREQRARPTGGRAYAAWGTPEAPDALHIFIGG